MQHEDTKSTSESSLGDRLGEGFVLTSELQRLLDKWDLLREQGSSITPEELCPDRPELAAQLHECLRAMKSFARFELNAELEPPCPEQIGHYRVIEELARGGTSVIYLVEQSLPKRRIALKLLNTSRTPAKVQSRFQLEVQILAALDHPGIAQIFDAGVTQVDGVSRSYFTMEWIEGENLRQYVQRRSVNPNWAAKDTIRVCLEICEALRHAHAAGVIHRDLKPSNLMVRRDGKPKVIDFGIARVLSSDVVIRLDDPTSQVWAGTRPYMSPEQFGLDDLPIDARTDVYSMAVVIYQLLTDEFPYPVENASTWKTADLIRHQPPVPISRHDRRLAGDLEVILDTALSKSPGERYGSMAEFAEDLKRFVDGEPICAPRRSAAAQLHAWAGRHKIAASLAASVFAFFVLLSAWAVSSTRLAEQRNMELQAAFDRLAAADRQVRSQASRLQKNRLALEQSNAELNASNDSLRRATANRKLGRLVSLVNRQPDYVVAQLLDPNEFPNASRGFAWQVVRQMANRRVAAWSADPEQLFEVMLSPDGRSVVTSGRTGLAVWDVQTKTASVRSEPDATPAEAVRPSVDWQAKQLFYVTESGTLIRLNCETDTSQVVTIDWQGSITAVEHADAAGSLLIGNKQGVVGYRQHDGQWRWQQEFLNAAIVAVAVDSRGDRAAAVSAKGDLVICQLKDGQPIKHQTLPLQSIERATFSPDLRWALIARKSDHSLLWDIESGSTFWRKRYQGWRPDLDWIGIDTSTQEPIVCVSGGGQVARWRGHKLAGLLQQEYAHPPQHEDSKDAAPGTLSHPVPKSMLPASIDAAPGAGLIAIGRRNGDLAIRTLEASQPIQKLPHPFAMVNRLAHSADGKLLALSGGGGNVQVIDLETSHPVTSFTGVGKSVRQLWFSPQGTQLSVLDQGAGIANLRVDDGTLLSVASSIPATRHSFAINDDRLVGWDTAGPLWLSECLQNESRTERRAGGFYCADFAPATSQLLTADNQGQLILRERSGKAWRELARATVAEITVIKISPAGTHAALCDSLGNVGVWRLPSLEQLSLIQPNGTRASCVTFSRDGTTMVTGHFDGEIQIWDTVNWEPQITLPTDLTPVRAVEFSPDGKRLLVGGKGDHLCCLGAEI